jgi:hypothetical protein
VVAIITKAYQEFAYERSLAQELYKSKRKGDVHNDSEVNNPKD